MGVAVGCGVGSREGLAVVGDWVGTFSRTVGSCCGFQFRVC